MLENAGIDVSKWQGEIDWQKVAAAGCKFAICKATQGKKHNDPTFERNWKGARDNGIIPGAYHFSNFSAVPQKEVDNFLAAVEPLLDDGPWMLAGDFEWGQNGWVPDPDHAVVVMRTWMEAIEAATGRRPLLYTNASFWYQIRNPLGFGHYPAWLSRYVRSWERSSPPLPDGWEDWAIWQYRGDAFPEHNIAAGQWPGVTPPASACDLNHFNGTEADLLELAGGRIATPPTAAPAPPDGVDVADDGGKLIVKPVANMEHASVRAIQLVLNVNHNAGLLVDGLMGPLTRAALAEHVKA